MPESVLRTSRASVATAFAAVVLMVIGTAWSMYVQANGEAWVRHTLSVQLALEAAKSHLALATVQDRNYLLTRDPKFAAAFENGIASAENDITRVAELTRDNPRQVASVQRLRAIVASRTAIARLAMTRSGVQHGLTPAEVLRLEQGPPSATDLRAQFATMAASEQRLLEERQARLRSDEFLTVAALIVLGAILLAAGYHILQAFAARVRELRRHEGALIEANQRLRQEGARREEVETQVRQLQKMESLGQLTGGIAHDFNNMLAIVMGSLEMARRKLGRGDQAAAEEAMHTATEGARAAAQLTRRLLAFSRNEALKPRLLDPNTFLAGMQDLLRRTLGESVRVDTELEADLPHVCVDPAQLESVIVNVAINARDAMPGGGKLCIRSEMALIEAGDPILAPGAYVSISLSDTGTGIPHEIIHRVFDPFFTTKGPGKGTGLGLAQVYGFARQSGGSVKIESEPGKGTKVMLYLPQHDGMAEEGEAPAATMPMAKESEIILMVEDNEQVREVSADQLGELGYTVIAAESAHDALAQLAVQPKVDLLLTDVIMPEVDGRTLSELVHARRPEVKVLFTTGYVADVELGPGAEVLHKPFTQEQLAQKVREVLDA